MFTSRSDLLTADKDDDSLSAVDVIPPPSETFTNDDSSSLLFKKILKDETSDDPKSALNCEQANEVVDQSLATDNVEPTRPGAEPGIEMSEHVASSCGEPAQSSRMVVASGIEVNISEKQAGGEAPPFSFDLSDIEVCISDIYECPHMNTTCRNTNSSTVAKC